MKMLRFTLGVTKLDKVRNEYIRGTAGVRRPGEKLREGRLGWLGHLKRRTPGYCGTKSAQPRDRMERKREAEETAHGHNPGRGEGGRSGGRRYAGQGAVENYDS